MVPALVEPFGSLLPSSVTAVCGATEKLMDTEMIGKHRGDMCTDISDTGFLQSVVAA